MLIRAHVDSKRHPCVVARGHIETAKDEEHVNRHNAAMGFVAASSLRAVRLSCALRAGLRRIQGIAQDQQRR